MEDSILNFLSLQEQRCSSTSELISSLSIKITDPSFFREHTILKEYNGTLTYKGNSTVSFSEKENKFLWGFEEPVLSLENDFMNSEIPKDQIEHFTWVISFNINSYLTNEARKVLRAQHSLEFLSNIDNQPLITFMN